MRPGTRGRYAVTAVVDLAVRGGERPVPLADIAAQQAISLSYLEQLFSRLRRAGVVRSVRGPGGGYLLGRPASSLKIADIVLAVEGLGHETDAVRGDRPPAATQELWRQLGNHVHVFLDSVSVQDVIDGRMPGLAGPGGDARRVAAE